MNQPTLFDNPPTATAAARQSDPVTSVMAADRAEQSGRAADQRSVVFEFVRRCPGRTSREIAAALGMQRQAPARRLPELAKDNRVKRGDKRACRIAGTLAVTWWPK